MASSMLGTPLRPCPPPPASTRPRCKQSSPHCSLPGSSPSLSSPLFSDSFLSSKLALPNPKPCTRLRTAIVTNAKKSKEKAPEQAEQVEEEQEVEVELSWVEEKAEDVVQYVTSAVKAVPGPRVAGGDLPWLLAVPLGYVAISFVIAVVKTARKLSSPREKRRRQVGKNAWLCSELSSYLPSNRTGLTPEVFQKIAKQSDFEPHEVLRKYIRYALNEKPFNPELVADLIHLREVSGADDASIAEVLNEVSRRIVKAKGPVVMNTTGFTEKGLKRKASVQALFSKILYLAELNSFCSTEGRSALSIKEIFGVTEEDANSIRIESLSGTPELESLEKMIGGAASDDEEEEEK